MCRPSIVELDRGSWLIKSGLALRACVFVSLIRTPVQATLLMG